MSDERSCETCLSQIPNVGTRTHRVDVALPWIQLGEGESTFFLCRVVSSSSVSVLVAPIRRFIRPCTNSISLRAFTLLWLCWRGRDLGVVVVSIIVSKPVFDSFCNQFQSFCMAQPPWSSSTSMLFWSALVGPRGAQDWHLIFACAELAEGRRSGGFFVVQNWVIPPVARPLSLVRFPLRLHPRQPQSKVPM